MTKKSYSDIELLDSLRSANRNMRNDALRYIYKKQYGRVASYVKRNSGNERDAEDVFQEGLTVLYEKVVNGAFKHESAISTFLFAICKNQWSKRLKKASTRYEVYGVESDVALSDKLPLDAMIENEEAETLASLFESIDCSCKKILILYYYEKRRMKEIADLMGLANDMVAKNKKNRCLNKLRTLAQKLPNFKSFANS